MALCSRLRRRTRRVTAGRDDGAAVVEFVMMTLLLVLLLFAVLQFAVFVYARNVVAASAAAGARYGASAGTDLDAASNKATSLIAAGLTGATARRITCSAADSTDVQSGVRTVQVRCSGPVRMVLLPFAMPARIDTSSSAVKEGRP